MYRLLNGVDSFGNVCGRKNDDGPKINNTNINMQNFGKLYFADPTDDNAPKICVPECPYEKNNPFGNTLSACTGCEQSYQIVCGP